MLPPGLILIWHSDIVNIPDGWALCDGNNGTPDLTDKFVIGAGGFFDPGVTGGSATHNHDFTGNGHTHTIPVGTGLGDGVNKSDITDSTAVTGITDNKFAPPPYRALAYIMKL